jgi:LemA protein
MVIDTTFLAVGALMLLSGYAVRGCGNRVRMKQQVTKAWALIERPLAQRRDAVRELETCCRGSIPQESGTLERVLAAQAQGTSAHLAFNAAAFGSAESELRTGLRLLFTAAENARGQHTNAPCQDLCSRILGLEVDIADRSRRYNSAVNFHNMRIRQFPYLLLARPLGFQPFDRIESDTWETTGLKGSSPPQP